MKEKMSPPAVRERQFAVDGQFERYLIGRYQYNVDVGNRKERYLLTYGFNISELKAIQMELEQALKAKDEFLATVSHEIRTPLHSIIVLAELLNQGHREDEHGDFATNIRTSSNHLLELVNDLLDFSKADAGKMTLDPEPVEVLRLRHRHRPPRFRTAQGHRRLQKARRRLQGGRRPWSTAPDSNRWSPTCSPMPSNSPRQEPSNWTSAQKPSEDHHLHMRWSVKDSGIGISAEDQQRILDAFQQANTGISRRFGGTGLGLGIVVRILELMGSELHIDSTLGEGSTFSFTLDLPLVQDAPIDCPSWSAEAHPPSSPLTCFRPCVCSM